jgi:D-alanyl-lipoteichoic acid acyltransferase DltB (MBOAT superfamily)
VYISLGGNRKGIRRMYINVAIVFVLSGFWHGANWTYIFWGALHAFFVMCYMLITSYYKPKFFSGKLIGFAGLFFTFCLVCFAWIFFRANSLQDAFLICRHIFSYYHSVPFQLVLTDVNGAISFTKSALLISIAMIVVMFIIEKKIQPDMKSLSAKPLADILFCSIVLSLVILLGVFNNNNFIYFQF